MWKVEKKTLKGLTCSYTLPSFLFQKLGGKGVKAFRIKATEVVIFYKITSFISTYNKIITVCAALVNLCPGIIPFD